MIRMSFRFGRIIMKTMEENEDIDDEEVWDITARSIFSLPAMMDHNELKNSDRLLMRPLL